VRWDTSSLGGHGISFQTATIFESRLISRVTGHVDWDRFHLSDNRVNQELNAHEGTGWTTQSRKVEWAR
jgi:hypothetical protein